MQDTKEPDQDAKEVLVSLSVFVLCCAGMFGVQDTEDRQPSRSRNEGHVFCRAL